MALSPIQAGFAAALLLFASMGALAQPQWGPYDPAYVDPRQYRAVQFRHMRIVQRAERSCAAELGSYAGPSFRAYVIPMVDSTINQSGNQALIAYYYSLPMHARYSWR